MKERPRHDGPNVIRSDPHRFLVLSFQNPLLRWLCWVFFLLVVIRLSYVGSRGLPVPDVGSRAEFYYVAPRQLVCQKPNPSYEMLAEKATAQASPIYRHDPAWLQGRLQQVESVRQQLETDLEALKTLKKRQATHPTQKGTAEGVKNSPFYQGGGQKAPAAKATADTKEAFEQQAQNLRDGMYRYLLGIAPGLTRSELLGLLKVFENHPENVSDTFRALEASLREVSDWYVVETSNLEFQQDRVRGISLAGTPPVPLAVDSLRTVAETIDLLQSRIVPEVVATKFHRLRGQRSVSAFLNRAAAASIRPTLNRDQAATQEALAAAMARVPETVSVEFTTGQSVISVGETVTAWQRDCIASLVRHPQTVGGAITVLGLPVSMARVLVGLALLIVLSALSLKSFSVKVFPDRVLEGKDAVAIGVLLALHLALVRISLFLADLLAVAYPSLSAGVILAACPVGLSAALLQLLLGARVSLLGVLFTFLPTALVAQQSGVELFGGDYPLYFTFYCMACSLAGIWVTRRVTMRGAFLVAGLATGCVGAAWWALAWLLSGGMVAPEVVLQLVLASFLSGVVTYILMISVTPIFEYLWDYTTTSRLLELASTDHSALKELSLRAPGTYQHSMFIATLVEDAAQAVGANALLARVGAYYHDLGKLAALDDEKKAGDSPLYFAENQSGNNPHDRLDPRTSASILRRHVAQSIHTIRKYRLGKRIMDIAAQHHGTTLMEHFYAKAMTQAQLNGRTVDDMDFRYPGPKPQSKEAALVMLADSVEAAVRSMTDHDEESISAKVRGIIAKRVDDGQMDESGLTFGDAKAIERSFVKTLSSMYHVRPQYMEIKQDSTTIRISRDELEDGDDEITSDMQRLEKLRSATTKDLGRPGMPGVSARRMETSQPSESLEPKEVSSDAATSAAAPAPESAAGIAPSPADAEPEEATTELSPEDEKR